MVLWLLSISTFFGSSLSWASSFYYELQGGVAQVRNGDPFFGAGAPTTSDLGYGANASFGYSFSGGQVPMEAQIGLHYRLSTADSAGSAYSVQIPYVIARLQLSRIFFTGGVSPVVLRRTGSIFGFDNFNMVSGSLAFLGEGGFLWAVTPEFSLGASGAGQYITSSAGNAAMIYEVMAVMRFYFGFSSGSGSSRSSNEFRGWRYPFGNELRN